MVHFIRTSPSLQPGGVNPDTTARVARPMGCMQGDCLGSCPGWNQCWTAPSRFVVEGSNTGDIGVAAEWTEVGRTASLGFPGLGRKSSGQGSSLSGGASTGCVVHQRSDSACRSMAVPSGSFVRPVRGWRRSGDLRHVDSRMTGIGADGEQTVLDNSLIRTVRHTTEPTSTVVRSLRGPFRLCPSLRQQHDQRRCRCRRLRPDLAGCSEPGRSRQ